jgi:hypothetical protein
VATGHANATSKDGDATALAFSIGAEGLATARTDSSPRPAREREPTMRVDPELRSVLGLVETDAHDAGPP